MTAPAILTRHPRLADVLERLVTPDAGAAATLAELRRLLPDAEHVAPKLRIADGKCAILWQVDGADAFHGRAAMTLRYPEVDRAAEALVTAGIAPADTCDRDPARQWVTVTAVSGPGLGVPVERCDVKPFDLPTLVAVSSIGPETWLRAEVLARSLVPGGGASRPVVRWRAMGREELAGEHKELLRARDADPAEPEPATVAEAAMLEPWLADFRTITGAPGDWRVPWPKLCPWESEPLRAAWATICELALLGVYPAAIETDPPSVTLALESVTVPDLTTARPR